LEGILGHNAEAISVLQIGVSQETIDCLCAVARNFTDLDYIMHMTRQDIIALEAWQQAKMDSGVDLSVIERDLPEYLVKKVTIIWQWEPAGD